MNPIRCLNSPQSLIYSGYREQFPVWTDWTKHSWKIVHGIASQTKSIIALFTALSLLYFVLQYYICTSSSITAPQDTHKR